MILGLFPGEEDGVNVKKTRFDGASVYLYLTDFCVEFVKLVVTASH